MTPSKVRVLIATTGGPVEIESLYNETVDIGGSVACIAGGTSTAGFDHEYRAFVAPRTGIIARLFGHNAFRLDISSQIDTGLSWQVPVFMAHALHSVGRLAHKHDVAGQIILATGGIRVLDRSVVAVGFVNDKLRCSLNQLRAEASRGCKIIALWPKTNESDVDSELRETLHFLNIEVLEADHVQALLSKFEIPVQPPSTGSPLASSLSWDGSPFRGLEPFNQEHRRIFFGRGRAREEVLEHLKRADARNCAFILIHGRSGAGKSSLARAGILDDVAQTSGPSIDWRAVVIEPSRGDVSPTSALFKAIANAVPELKLEAEAFVALSRSRPADAVNTIVRALSLTKGSRPARLILLIDQLEELFLWAREQGSSEAANLREAFSEYLNRLSRSGSVWVIATLRSDLLSLLEDSPSMSRLASDQRLYRLERPTRAELREIVKGPIELVQLSSTGVNAAGSSLVDVLVDAAAAAPDSLPLLQFVLARLYESAGRSGCISHDMYENVGGLEGAIGQHAEKVIGDLGEGLEIEHAINDILLTLGRQDVETGSIVARTASIDPGYLTGPRERVVKALERARLIVLDNTDGRLTARIAHDALLTHWERAREIFEKRNRELELRDRLENDARKWAEEGKDQAYLIARGRPLQKAQELASAERVHISPRTRAYIVASREKSSRIEVAQRRLQMGKIAAVIVFAILSVVAIVNWRRAQYRIDAAIDAISVLVEIASQTVKPIAQLDKTETVLNRANQAIAIQGDARLNLLHARSLLILTEIDLDRGNIDEMRKHASEAFQLLGPAAPGEDVEIKHQRARSRHWLGRANAEENKNDAARAEYLSAISELTKIVDVEKIQETWHWARSLAGVRQDLGDVLLFRLSEPNAALSEFNKSRDLHFNLLNAVSSSGSIAEYEIDIKHDIAWLTNKLGDVAVMTKNDSNAMQYFLEARDRMESLGDNTLNNVLWAHHLAILYNNIGLIHFRRADYERANASFEAAESLLVQLMKRDLGNQFNRAALIWTYNCYAQSLFRSALADNNNVTRLTRSRIILNKAIEEHEKLPKAAMKRFSWRLDIALIRANSAAVSGALALTESKFDIAASYFLQGEKVLMEQYLPHVKKETATEVSMLAVDFLLWKAAAYQKAGLPAQAIAACKQAIDVTTWFSEGDVLRLRERAQKICP